MTSRSSLTTSRLAALSLSPSRIAQLGIVKPDSELSFSGDDSKQPRKSRRKGEEQEGYSDATSDTLGVHDSEGKRRTGASSEPVTGGETPRRPNTDRRKSSLNSLDEDEEEDGSPRKESGVMTGAQENGRPEHVEKGQTQEQADVSSRQNEVVGDLGTGGSAREHQFTPSSPSSSLAPSPLTPPTIHISSNVPTSPTLTPNHNASTSSPARPRSPPPSYDFATSPSALHHSSHTRSTSEGSPTESGRASADSARFMSTPGGETTSTSRRKGKQRAFIPDDLTSSETSTAPSSSSNGIREGHAMLELLPNSDTEGEEVTPLPFTETGDRAGPSSHLTSPAQTVASTSTLSTADRLRPLLLPQARTRSFTPPISPKLLAVASRGKRPGSRRAYTGPVQIIDRTGESEEVSDAEEEAVEGEGWMTPISGTDIGTGTNTPVGTIGYHLSSSLQAERPDIPLNTPQSPNSATSGSNRHSLSPPTDGAFTADVYVSGWKIIGGRSKGVASPSPLPSSDATVVGNAMGRSPTGHDVVELQKGRLGAYVVYECEITTRAGTKITRLRRYNDFLALYNALQRAFPNAGASLPPLPPKNRLSKFEPTYLSKRQVKLQFWLKCVLLHPSLGAHEACRKFVLDV